MYVCMYVCAHVCVCVCALNCAFCKYVLVALCSIGFLLEDNGAGLLERIRVII